MEYDSKKLLILFIFLLLGITSLRSKEYVHKSNLNNELVLNVKDIEWLARTIYAEAAGESFEGKLGVGNVILNRCENRQKSIVYIIFEKGQFDGVRTKWFKTKYKTDEVYHECVWAAIKLLKGYRIFKKKSVEYFHNPKISTDSKWIKYIEKFREIQIDNHLFCNNPNLV